MNIIKKLSVFCLLCLGLINISHAAQPKPDQSMVYKTVGEVDLKLHMFLPKQVAQGIKTPAIIFFFGGGWVSGNPNQFYRQADYLADRGILAISAEYRVKKRNNTTPKDAVSDAKSAMRWLRQNADKLNIDPDQIIAAGGSAGAHLAASTATIPSFNAKTDDLTISTVPNALVLFNPVFDNGPDGWGYETVKNYWQDISPMHNLHAGVPPTLVLIGDKDKLIPISVPKRFQQKMHALGIRSELEIYPGQGHGFFNYKNKNNFRDTLLKVDNFLVSLGYLKGQADLQKINAL
ncbi:alpha/beta hydrolase [Gayadomonas joobiniege]|uniref:alpha/beta hydrolase n=1 Tax=Gayadomonas joobiniege TaxID=1234606 RepID=UPI00138ACE85|nr:alpha/beta hydrolase [Gayadomonas joobiniege]